MESAPPPGDLHPLKIRGDLNLWGGGAEGFRPVYHFVIHILIVGIFAHFNNLVTNTFHYLGASMKMEFLSERRSSCREFPFLDSLLRFSFVFLLWRHYVNN